ncbi:Mitochondrial import receptor [Dirofilaria immitis]
MQSWCKMELNEQLLKMMKFSFVKSALWIVSSSMMILVLPYVIEKERSEYEKSQVAQQRQMLLGPSAAVSAVKQ